MKKVLSLSARPDRGVGRSEASVFLEGRDLAERMDDARSVARLCSAYGISKALALEPADETLALIDEAREIAGEIDDPAFTLRLAPDWAVAYGNVGKPGDSFRITEELIEQARSDPRLAGVINRSRAYMLLLVSRSNSLFYRGRLAEAAQTCEEVCQFARTRNADEVLVWGAGNLAECRAEFGDHEGALHAAREAVEAAERVGSRVRGAAYRSLAKVHTAVGEWNSARDAAELSLSIDDRGVWYADALNAVTEICIETGDYGRAAELVAEARTLGLRGRAELDARLAQARLLLRAEGLAAKDQAERILTELRDACETLGLRPMVARIDLEAAELARLLGDDAARERHLREAHRLYTEMGATGHAQRVGRELAGLGSSAVE